MAVAGHFGDNAKVPFIRASNGATVRLFVYAPRRIVGVPGGCFLIRVAPFKPAKLVPFQAGANTIFVVVPNRMIASHSDPEPPDE